jgi:hypothetical protein
METEILAQTKGSRTTGFGSHSRTFKVIVAIVDASVHERKGNITRWDHTQCPLPTTQKPSGLEGEMPCGDSGRLFPDMNLLLTLYSISNDKLYLLGPELDWAQARLGSVCGIRNCRVGAREGSAIGHFAGEGKETEPPPTIPLINLNFPLVFHPRASFCSIMHDRHTSRASPLDNLGYLAPFRDTGLGPP